jgi:hypothetical protein
VSIEGTVRFASKVLPPVLPAGAELEAGGELLTVDSVLRVGEDANDYIARGPLGAPLQVRFPAAGVRVLKVPGLEQLPVKYGALQEIPRPLLLRRKASSPSLLFGGLPSSNSSGPTVPVSAEEYMKDLRAAGVLKLFSRLASSHAAQLQSAEPLLAALAPVGAARFHEKAAVLINPGVGEVTKVQVLPMSRNRETTIEGAAQVLAEMLVDAGVLVDPEDGGSMLPPGGSEKVLHLYGDQLSVERLHQVLEKAVEKSVGSGANASGRAARSLLSAMRSVRVLPGDLHVNMQMLDALYRAFYGGLLQPAQATVRWNRLGRDPTKTYQTGLDLANLVGVELQRLAVRTWEQSVALGEMEELGAGQELAEALLKSYHEFLEKRRKGTDAVSKFAVQYLDVWEDVKLHWSSIRVGDSLAVEHLTARWAGIFAAVGKHNYVVTSARSCEQFYGAMDPWELETARRNRFVRLNPGRAMIGKDDMCEMVNRWVKDLYSRDDEHMCHLSTRFLALLRRCGETHRAWSGNAKSDPKSSLLAAREMEMQAVFSLLSKARLMAYDQGRKISEDFVWKFVPAVTLHSAEEGNVGRKLTARESLIKSMFEAVRKQKPTPARDEENDGDSEAERSDGEAEGSDGEASGASWLKNMKRYEINPTAKRGLRLVGAKKMEGYELKRQEQLSKLQKRKEQLLKAVQRYEEFCTKMAAQMEGGSSTASAPAPAWRAEYEQLIALREQEGGAAPA